MTAGAVRDPVAVGPYRLVRRLGEGGMGVVHLALDPAGRQVALKMLRIHVSADDDALRRLGREVASLRRVRHPLVAPVLDADLLAEQPYLVTRFVPGRSLHEEVCARGPLPAADVARIGRGLAAALAEIHAVGVVHRDLKPANVMMAGGEPVIIDFGIAHVPGESRITRTGLLMGTPGYLPPELIYGKPVSAATDWWAWGATLAFAATGRPPFGAGRVEVVFDRVRRGDCDLDGVHPRLERVLRGALTVDPAARPRKEHLLAQLAPLITGGGTASQAQPRPRSAGPSLGGQPRPAPRPAPRQGPRPDPLTVRSPGRGAASVPRLRTRLGTGPDAAARRLTRTAVLLAGCLVLIGAVLAGAALAGAVVAGIRHPGVIHQPDQRLVPLRQGPGRNAP